VQAKFYQLLLALKESCHGVVIKTA
jgi:hypothetical protein